MRRTLYFTMILAILALGIIPAACAGAAGTGVGDSAPDFSIASLDGQTTTLSSFRGNTVLLNFWASWCGPCRLEMPYLELAYRQWSDTVTFLAVNVGENADTVNSFVGKNDFNLPVLMDTDNAVAGQYGIQGIPTTFFIDENGIIRSVKIGPFTGKAEIDRTLRELTE